MNQWIYLLTTQEGTAKEKSKCFTPDQGDLGTLSCYRLYQSCSKANPGYKLSSLGCLSQARRGGAEVAGWTLDRKHNHHVWAL